MNTLSNIPNEEKSKKWFCLWRPIIENIQKLSCYRESNLLRTLSQSDTTYNWCTIKHLTEYALENARDAKKIFSRISNKLKSDTVDHNEIINQMMAELRAVPILNTFGINDLTYTREAGVDYNGRLKERSVAVEVTYICGPNFKTQKQVTIGGHDLFEFEEFGKKN